MLLKKSSKQARSGFKRKKLSVAGTYQEIKSKGIPPQQTGAKLGSSSQSNSASRPQ
jgi:hypothetical protein